MFVFQIKNNVKRFKMFQDVISFFLTKLRGKYILFEVWTNNKNDTQISKSYILFSKLSLEVKASML